MKKFKLYTLTPNPALDLSGHVSQIIPNEKNYVFKPRIDPGGNGLNVARMSGRLGANVLALGFLGGATGEQIKNQLQLEKIPHQFIKIKQNNRTNVTVTNDSDHQQTRLTFPGPQISKTEWNKLLQLIKNFKGPGLFNLGGSLPQGLSSKNYLQIAQLVANQHLDLIVDVPSKYLYSLLRKNAPYLFLIKPNEIELNEFFGKKFNTIEQMSRAALKLNQFSKLVCISLGKKGALLAYDQKVWQGIGPKIKAKGSVGAGDSMVAAMASQILKLNLISKENFQDKDIKEILSWGLAAGAATASTEGTGLGSAKQIKLLSKKVKILQII